MKGILSELKGKKNRILKYKFVDEIFKNKNAPHSNRFNIIERNWRSHWQKVIREYIKLFIALLQQCLPIY